MKKSIINFEKIYLFHDKKNTLNVNPFPWFNYSGFLHESSFVALLESFPKFSYFEEHKGMKRIHNQAPHDRFYCAFEHSIHHPFGYIGPGVIHPHQLALCWQDFLGELNDKPYENFIKEVLELSDFKARYDWHIGVRGSEVSPHIDASAKLASHLFFLNTVDDWNSDWGGQTLILISKKTKAMNPTFYEFEERVKIDFLNNKSFLFKNTPEAWHGVEALKCPINAHRRLFNVVFEIQNADTKSMSERANM